MAKKYFLTILALMFCFNAFSQTTDSQGRIIISNATDFLKIGTNGYPANGSYIQTADIDLGIVNSTPISTFSGTYNGNGKTISYTASYTVSDNGKYGLFGEVTSTGKIQYLNVNANATISGRGSGINMGLVCGFLNGGLIEYCNVKTEITSTVSPGIIGNAGTGLIAGRCDGTIQYCTGTGAVVGSGYVGGLVGQMGYLQVEWGIIWVTVKHYGGGTIKGCSFSGSVTAQEGGLVEDLGGLSAVGGGLCGLVTNNSSITSCCVDAVVNSDETAMGAGVTTTKNALVGMKAGTPLVNNNYCTGSVNGNTINENGEITNSSNSSNNNYTTNSSSTVGTLNDNKNDNNIRFETVNGEVVLIIGQQGEVAVCVAPTNLQITQGQDGNHTATWDFEGPATFLYTLSGGVYNSPLSGTTTDKTVSTGEPLTPSPNPYVFTVKTKCGEDNFSEEISQSFIVECPKPTNLSVSNISYNSITVTYTAPAKSKLTVGSTEIVSENAGEITKTITGLTPETEYEVRVEVMCGSEYEESLSTNITTTAIPAPTGLAVSTAYDGTEEKGSANIAWDMVDGLTYEIEGQQGDKTSEYTIDNLAIGNYTLRLRAKVSGKTSAWVEMPYTISSPEAPYNPQVTYTQDGDTYDVTITWQKGATGDVQGWKVNGGDIQNTQTFTLENQTPGTSTNVSIVEYVNANTFSRALIVPIQVPCLSATLPTDVSTTQTTATFTFANENSNRKIVIGSNEYDADDASVTISNLNTATNYNYSVVEYCTQTLYSEKTGTFATKSCYAVSNLQARATGMTTATASWESQSGGGLKFNVILLNGATEVVNIDTTATTYDFTGLHTATTYTLKVSEQCGVGYGEVRTINFTTESSEYTTKQSGDFNTSATWVNNRVPKGNTANITIGSGHEITISHALTITDSYKIVSNQGVLQITQQGELINTTNTNVGGIVEIVTPQKTINQWTFIGAPFTTRYKLETVVPAQNDISVSKFDYSSGQWSNGWATIETEMEAGEGMFAWLFYSGLVTFTTYGDKGTFTSEYNFNNPPATSLNNDNEITVTESLTTSSGGKWMALANPYPFKLKVATFLADNTLSETNPNPDPNSNNIIQGEVIYKFNGSNWTTHNSGDILMTEGFFVNFVNEGENIATFKKTQRLANQSKSAITPREFVKLALVDGKKEIDLLFAHNEKSENSYDIYDANKMFSPIEIAEPYFVTGGFDLVKEEVKELPYYATMNVRSYKDTVMSFVMKSIPEGLKVSIIDGENVINMYEGSVYTTEFLKGENEDRFKLYVRKADRLEEVRGRSVSITNCNRLVNVQSKEKDLTMDVFNAVGQIVYSTTEYNFNLASLPAGTYIVMAHNKRVNERVKIVIN